MVGRTHLVNRMEIINVTTKRDMTLVKEGRKIIERVIRKTPLLDVDKIEPLIVKRGTDCVSSTKF